eukprot:g4110.t1
MLRLFVSKPLQISRFSRCASTLAEDVMSVSHSMNNVSPGVAEKLGRNLHLKENHPLSNIKRTIEDHFTKHHGEAKFKFFDNLSPLVTIEQNFDALLIPKDHVSRSASDTFYVDDQRVLRCHTSAHQNELIAAGHRAFLCTGDVYRRDTVDSSHYPVFHQMEGVRIFNEDEIPLGGSREVAVAECESNLKKTLEGMVRSIFGDVDVRWVDAHFPFTSPSIEMEIYFQDEWLEVLGCGVIQQEILRNCGRGDETGWAFGLGLERLAMVLWGIPDIRLFWSNDRRFLDQFEYGRSSKFTQFSKYPPCLKDISFWLPDNNNVQSVCENDIHECVREEAGDLVECVELIDNFVHPKTGRVSHCYRINYRSMERNLTNAEIDSIQMRVRDRVSAIGCELR